MPEQDYLTNSYAIRNAANTKAAARKARGKPAKRDARAKKLERWLKRNGYTNADLWAKLGRDGWDMKTPEERTAISKRTRALREVKRRFCDHMRLAPKLRASGPNAGRVCCPSCHRPVPGEIIAAWEAKKDGGLVV